MVRFFSKFRIQSRMILVNTVPNPNLLTQSVGKLSHRENPQVFFWVFFWGFFGVWVVGFSPNFRIQSRMILVNTVQYKSLKVIRNGGKSKKSKTSFGASPIEDLDGFYQRPFPEERKSDFNFIQFRKCLPKLSSLHRCHDGLVVRVLGIS